MKKKISQEYSFGEHYYAVLIQSQLADYQFAWSLNNGMRVDFRKLPELPVYDPKKAESSPYNLYRWSSPNALDYFLVAPLEKPTALSSETFLLIEKRERRENVNRFIEKTSAFGFVFSIEEITLDAPSAKIAKHRQRIEHLNNIAIDLEQHLDALKKTRNTTLKRKSNTPFL